MSGDGEQVGTVQTLRQGERERERESDLMYIVVRVCTINRPQTRV